jgi:hypothetical protein
MLKLPPKRMSIISAITLFRFTFAIKNLILILTFFLFLLNSNTINSNKTTKSTASASENEGIEKENNKIEIDLNPNLKSIPNHNPDLNTNSKIISDNDNENDNDNVSIKINLKIKNILVIIFPGGKSHHFVMKKLFDFVLNSKNKSNYIYNFHILVHNYDKEFWLNAPKSYKIYGFGDVNKFDIIFNKALLKVREDPVFGYKDFHKAMIHIMNEFATSEILNVLQKLKFDMIITDIPNCIFKFLKEKLEIKLSLFLSPPAVPNLFYGLFELNPVTLPALGTSFTDKLNFWQRLQNFFYVYGFKIMGSIFMREQFSVFESEGHQYKDYNYFDYDALIMIQYPIGFAYNISRPPNMIFLNYITPSEPKSLEKEDIGLHNFLNIYKKNVYVCQGTIFKNIDFSNVIKVFEDMSEVGFVLSIKKDILEKYKFPKNVHLKQWVNQNDLLGDKRINAFVSHGGINSIVEAIYHKKPTVALGVSIDQVNTAGMVKIRETGISFFSQNDITPENLTRAIKTILEDGNKYLKNTERISQILKMNKPATEDFAFWLEYGFNFGYEHLIIKAYSYYNSYQFYNIDIISIFILIFILVIWYIKILLVRLISLLLKYFYPLDANNDIKTRAENIIQNKTNY